MSTHAVGSLAERLAALFLMMNGYSVLASGYRFRGKELDLVVAKGATVAFVEVKFRSGTGRGAPRESVDARKRRHIVFAARGFVAERGLANRRLRFDVIEISMTRGGLALAVEHLTAAFRAASWNG
jgi:putative endonuclease